MSSASLDKKFMSSTSLDKPRPSPLPAKPSDWDALRDMKTIVNLNDMIEPYHRSLLNDKQYCDYLEAVYDEDAVEGSCTADHIFASMMIRDAAKAAGDGYVAGKKVATIGKHLNTVLRRYHQSRKERRYSVHGENVAPGGSSSDE